MAEELIIKTPGSGEGRYILAKRYTRMHRRAQRAESIAQFWQNEAVKARNEADDIYYRHHALKTKHERLARMRPMWTRLDGLRLFLFGRA